MRQRRRLMSAVTVAWVSWLCAVANSPAAGVDASAPLKRTLYLSFDNGLDAAESVGPGKAEVIGEVPLADGKQGKGAVFEGGAYLTFDAAGNFDQNEGTLAMWVKPFWDSANQAYSITGGYEPDEWVQGLFEVPLSTEKGFGEAFVITKGWTTTVNPDGFYVTNSPPWRHINPQVVFGAHGWIHLIFTWSQRSGVLRTFANGRLAGAGRWDTPKYPSSEGRKIVVGARVTAQDPAVASADAVFDELQIFDRLVTREEAWRLAGGAEPVPTDSFLLSPDPLITLPHKLVTPHVPFARPLVGGPLQSFFIVPTELARDVVELWQRLELDYTAFTLGGSFPYGAKAKRFDGLKAWPSYENGLSWPEREHDLMRKLAAGPEVIVLVDAELDRAPAAARQKVLDLVRRGTGLVVTSRAAKPGPFFEQADPTGRGRITNGVPWSGLPELFAGEGLSSSELPERAVETYRCGKGRVAAIRFRSKPVPLQNIMTEDGLAPSGFGIPYTREWDGRYGRYLSLVGKAVLWASGREQSWRLLMPADGFRTDRSALPRTVEIKVTAAAAGGADLAIEIRDRLGQVAVSEEIPVQVNAAGAADVSVTIPTLSTGLHYLDARLSVAGKTADWGSVAFHVTGPEEIRAVELEKESVERGEEVRGKVALVGALTHPAELTVRAIDTAGRVYAEVRQAIPAGGDEAQFAVRLDDPATIASYIEAEIVRDGKTLARGSIVAFVPKRNLDSLEADEFVNILWWSRTAVSASGMIEARQLRSAGFNAALFHSHDVNARNFAMWDLSPVPYTIRLCVAADERGWGQETAAANPGEWPEDGSYGNPEARQAAWKLLSARLREIKNYGPFLYSLGDEDVYIGEFGFSPWGLKAYRQYLVSQYEQIGRLNREWGADYKSFEAVPRLRPDEAKANRKMPAMIAHRAAQEAVWQGMFAYLSEKMREYDPHAKSGTEGSLCRDLEGMLSAADLWAGYGDRRTDVLSRCVAGEQQILGHWWGSYQQDRIRRAGATHLWTQLFRGFVRQSFYFSGGAAINSAGSNLMPDLSPQSTLVSQIPDLRLIHAGIGQLLRTCKVKPYGLAIHWSQATRYGLEIADEFGTPETIGGSVIKILERERGIVNWNYITTRQLEERPALAMAERVVFLPASQCLSAGEAATLREFVEKGGVLVAAGIAGNRTVFGRELDGGQLDEVFGVRMDAPATVQELKDINTTFVWRGRELPLVVTSNTADKAVVATTGTVLIDAGGVPIVVHKRFGKGDALLLNLDLARCRKTPSERRAKSEMFMGLLAGAGLTVPVRFLPEPGPLDRHGVLQKGDLTLLGVIMDHRPGRWNGGTVILPQPAHVYDVKAGRYLGRLREIEISGRPDVQSAALFALQAERITEVTLSVPREIERDRPVDLECVVRAGSRFSCQGRVVRIELFGPDGQPRPYYRRMAYLDKDGRGKVTIEAALNDLTGDWKVVATDIASGLTTADEFALK